MIRIATHAVLGLMIAWVYTGLVIADAALKLRRRWRLC